MPPLEFKTEGVIDCAVDAMPIKIAVAIRKSFLMSVIITKDVLWQKRKRSLPRVDY